jgi:hypothetical protein
MEARHPIPRCPLGAIIPGRLSLRQPSSPTIVGLANCRPTAGLAPFARAQRGKVMRPWARDARTKHRGVHVRRRQWKGCSGGVQSLAHPRPSGCPVQRGGGASCEEGTPRSRHPHRRSHLR